MGGRGDGAKVRAASLAANTLTLPDILDFTFDVLTAAVGVIVILLAVRVTLTLTLSAHRRALQISIVAAAFIVGAQMAEVWADFSRLNTLKDVAGDFLSWSSYVL